MSSGRSYGAAWIRISRRMKELAGWRCQECGNAGKLETHHKQAYLQGGSHDADNLVVLCFTCHRRQHAGGWLRRMPPGWRELVEELL